MKEAKDLFSTQAATYAAFRPVYPQELYDFLDRVAPAHHCAWDCGTGNGQVATQLAKHFQQVYATDISEQQIAHAQQADNIHYKVTRAEKSGFPDQTFDLITVGTALHWFDFDAFYNEVQRVAKPGAIIAAWAYTPCLSDAATDGILDHFYHNIVGTYWNSERRYVDELYRTIPFPFREVETPYLEIRVHWTREQLAGYLHSWSAVQHYKNAHGTDPVAAIAQSLADSWGPYEQKLFTFPLFMRAGII